MHFDLTDLRLFQAVADAGSITGGAERAGLALASASARLRGMEEQAAVQLLERGRRGVRLTPAGSALLHHARQVLQQMERLRGELGDYARGLKGHVRVLANTAASTEFLPEALAGFLAAHPSVDVELEERPSIQAIQAIAEQAADVAVVADYGDLGGLQAFPFRVDRLVLALPPGHRLASCRSMTFAAALPEEFIGLAGDSALQRHLNAQAARTGGLLRLRARVPTMDAVCRMVSLGAGVGVVSETAARRWRRSGLHAVRLTDAWATRRMQVICRRFDALPVHAQRLVHHLVESGPDAP